MPRIDPDASPSLLTPALSGSAPVLPLLPEDELETPPLPREHPKWVKDAVAVSHRARQIIAQLRPVIIRVLTFWDHHIRGITINDRNLSIDASGSYRLD